LYNEEPQSVLFTKCYSGHPTEDEMDRASCVQGNYKQASELEGKKLFKRPNVDEGKYFRCIVKRVLTEFSCS